MCTLYARSNAQLSGTMNIDGSGTTTVITATVNHSTTIKSVTIKATMPVTQGMVRLFLASPGGDYALYKEVPVPTMPVLANTPTPTPIMKTFEVKIDGGLKLEGGYSLAASTQNGESFNVIAEGMDWVYADKLPPACCSFRQETAVTGFVTASQGNIMLDGTGPIVPILNTPLTPAVNGYLIKSITIKALQSTNEGMVRIFLGSIDGGPIVWTLFREVYVPQTTQSGFDPSFKMVLEENLNITQGLLLGASTQLGQSFAVSVEAVSWVYPTY